MMDVIIDGDLVAPEDATVSVFDLALQRGFGCFEAMHAYNGVVFRLDEHLDRLEGSAAALDIPIPARVDIESWARRQAKAGSVLTDRGESAVRIFITGGTDLAELGGPKTIVSVGEPPVVPDFLRFAAIEAPWHAGGHHSELTGAKTLSYAPNLAATNAAKQEGYDDAVLVSREGTVLEGPTFSVAWVADGVLETPTLDLGILHSITRQAVLGLAADTGVEYQEVAAPLARVTEASEMMAMSTFKEVRPVVQLDQRRYQPGPVTLRLQAAFRELTHRETT